MVCNIRVYFKWIIEKYKNSTGRISDSGGQTLQGTGQLSHCRPVWAEPWVLNTCCELQRLKVYITKVFSGFSKLFMQGCAYLSCNIMTVIVIMIR